ncbi:Protein RDR1 [Fusarium austroafricanum]|uniref:Protein RDR1 n=1 Tax=Fusarium austroafricanum TaxID=2364996 RepID=A0A8H4KJF4_9HYPO|nr:Protein RDR1 [Fusarium austroafricanum]
MCSPSLSYGGATPEVSLPARYSLARCPSLPSVRQTPPASQEMDLESDLPALTSQPLDYHLAMNWICHLMLQHLPRSPDTAPLRNYSNVFQDFDHYEASLAPHLQDRQRCSSILELQEHYSLALHRKFGL